VDEARIYLFGAQISERWINQGIGWQRESVSNQDRIDGQICRFIPCGVFPITTAAVVSQGNMHDLVGQNAFQLCGFQRLYKRGVVKNLPAIGCHGPSRARNELETDAQAAKERLTQEKLYAGLG